MTIMADFSFDAMSRIKLFILWWSFVHNVSEFQIAYAEVRYMKFKGGKKAHDQQERKYLQ